jgi:hypothetical protein
VRRKECRTEDNHDLLHTVDFFVVMQRVLESGSIMRVSRNIFGSCGDPRRRP